MHSRPILLIVCLVALLPPSVAGAAVTAPTSLTVRVYDHATGSDAVRQEAFAVAAGALSAASIDVTWIRCLPDAVRAACNAPEPGRLMVRILRSSGQQSGNDPRSLGEALIDRHVGAGVLATVYLDRITALARAARRDVWTLLGRAIAHELAHLLLATNAHSPYGLMRGFWSRDELRREHLRDWSFTPADVQALRLRAGGM